MRRLSENKIKSILHDKFGDKVSLILYDGFESKNSVFSCFKHGQFKTSYAVVKHSKYPCRKCYKEDKPNLARKKDISKELSFVKEKFKGVYDFSKFKPLGMVDKSILICPKHGEFEKDLFHLYNRGCGCNECGNETIGKKRTKSKEDYLSLFSERHGSTEDILDVRMVKGKKQVDIKCEKHGLVTLCAFNYLQKNSCPRCGDENREKYLGRSRFKNSCQKNGGDGYFYVLKASGESESFYKIGVTSSIEKRMYEYNIRCDDYVFDLIHIERGDAMEIYDKEIFTKSILKKNKYEPVHKFGGFTECYSCVENLSLWL